MANVVANSYKEVGPSFANNVEIYRFTYDFALDGGAFADVIQLAKFKKAGTLVWGYAKVLTTCVGATATVSVGVTGDPTAIMDATAGAVANLVANFAEGDMMPTHVAIDDYLTLDIGTANLTAGAIEVVFALLP